MGEGTCIEISLVGVEATEEAVEPYLIYVDPKATGSTEEIIVEGHKQGSSEEEEEDKGHILGSSEMEEEEGATY